MTCLSLKVILTAKHSCGLGKNVQVIQHGKCLKFIDCIFINLLTVNQKHMLKCKIIGPYAVVKIATNRYVIKTVKLMLKAY